MKNPAGTKKITVPRSGRNRKRMQGGTGFCLALSKKQRPRVDFKTPGSNCQKTLKALTTFCAV